MKLNKNQLLAIIIGLSFTVAFILGITTVYISQFLTSYNKIKTENSTLKAENANLNIEIKGLTRLMQLKDQDICHYSHREVQHNFRIINKTK